MNTQTNDQLLAQFTALFEQGKKEAQEVVTNSLNMEAVSKLNKAMSEIKNYTIEDVTPNGYGI